MKTGYQNKIDNVQVFLGNGWNWYNKRIQKILRGCKKEHTVYGNIHKNWIAIHDHVFKPDIFRPLGMERLLHSLLDKPES